MLRKAMVLVVVFGLVAGGGAAFGFSLTADQDLTTQAGVLNGGAEVINPTGTGTLADPWVYDWAAAGVSADLVLGSYKISTNESGVYPPQRQNESVKYDLNGGTITGSGTVALQSTATSRYAGTGDITVLNAGDINCGGITTRATGRDGNTGHIIVGEAVGSGDGPVGNIRVDTLDTRCGDSADSGDITVYGSGNVLIQNSGGTPGDVRTNYQRPDGNNNHPAGWVEIRHDGALVANLIDTHATSDNSSHGGPVTLEGDIFGDGASGTCTVDRIRTEHTFVGESNYRRNGGHVHISGYTGVTLGQVSTYRRGSTYSATLWRAGDLTIEDIEGDVEITGSIDLDGEGVRAGTLTITTTGSKITLAELDLDLMEDAVLTASGDSFVGELLHFDVLNPANGELVAAASGVVWYDPDVADNGYLGGGVYTLSDGWLAPLGARDPRLVPEPAGLSFLGLALFGLKRTKRS